MADVGLILALLLKVLANQGNIIKDDKFNIKLSYRLNFFG